MKFNLHKSTVDICIFCKGGIVYKVSDGFINLTGYSDYEILGKSIEQLNDLLKLNSQEALDSIEQIHNVYIFIKGDKPKEVTISSKYIGDKDEWIYNFEVIFNSSIDSLILDLFAFNFDSKKSIALYSLDNLILLQSNKQYTDLLLTLDVPTNNLVGQPPKYKEFLKDFINNEKYANEKEVEFINKDQQLVYLDIGTTPLHGDGKEKYLINIIYDVTDKVLARQHLKIQDETFINISHELKTPLNVIFSASQLIDIMIKKGSDIDINNQIESSNNIILDNCYRLTKLINNILDISKIESGCYDVRLANEDIVHVTEDIVQSIAQYISKMELQIVFDTNIEEKIIAIDLYKFERIMLNLISNAIKFSSPKGTILIDLYSKDDFIEISVQDFGIGIAKEHQDIIFNKFQQVNKSLNRKVEGTGIGLSLVKSLTELHNGTITVESTLGEGATFTLKLPVITVDSQNTRMSSDRTGMIRFEFSDIDY